MISPTARSMKALRDADWFVDRAERWNHVTKTRHDLFGFADLVALKNEWLMFVQCTSGSNAADRMAKISASREAMTFLCAPKHLIQVHAWRFGGKQGERKKWRCRVISAELVCGKIEWKEK